MIAVDDTTWWYVSRSSGIVAWAVLTGSVLWGLALSTKVLRGKPRPNWILDLHRYLGGLGVVFTLVHVGALLVHKYSPMSVGDVLFPWGTSDAKWATLVSPTAVGWGAAAFYLLIAVEVTSLLRRRLSKRVWRAVHFLSFPLFLVATLHGLTAGTDRTTVLFRAANIVAIVLVVGLTAMRVAKADRHDLMTSPPGAPRRIPVRTR